MWNNFYLIWNVKNNKSVISNIFYYLILYTQWIKQIFWWIFFVAAKIRAKIVSLKKPNPRTPDILRQYLIPLYRSIFSFPCSFLWKIFCPFSLDNSSWVLSVIRFMASGWSFEPSNFSYAKSFSLVYLVNKKQWFNQILSCHLLTNKRLRK